MKGTTQLSEPAEMIIGGMAERGAVTTALSNGLRSRKAGKGEHEAARNAMEGQLKWINWLVGRLNISNAGWKKKDDLSKS